MLVQQYVFNDSPQKPKKGKGKGKAVQEDVMDEDEEDEEEDEEEEEEEDEEMAEVSPLGSHRAPVPPIPRLSSVPNSALICFSI